MSIWTGILEKMSVSGGRAGLVTLMLLLASVNQIAGLPHLERVRRQGVLYSSVCEGRTMNLRCPPGQQILLESANFGRTDTVTCPQGAIKNTNCREPTSFAIVSNICDYKNYCQVRATNGVFGNPCPGTFKYLEVQFECIDPLRTTTISYFHVTLPESPNIATTQPPTTLAPVEPTTLRPVTQPPQTTTTPILVPVTTAQPVSSATSPTMKTTTKQATTPAETTTKATTTTVTTTSAASSDFDFCPETTRRGIQWPRTKSGKLSTQACPEGTSGAVKARWHCEGRPARWLPESGPDLSLCTSVWVEEIEDQVGVPASELSEVMANVVVGNEQLYGGDLLVVTTLMEDSLSSLKDELIGLNDTQKLNMAKTVSENYVKIGSTVLEGSKIESWQDLHGTAKALTATSLLTSIEESGFVVAENLGSHDKLTSAQGNIVLEVVVQDTSRSDFAGVSFPQASELASSDWEGITDSISLSKASLEDRSSDGQSRVVFLAYNNLGELLEPISYDGKDPEADFVVNSRIISASISDPRASPSLAEPAIIVLEHTEENLTSPVCSFWKFGNTTAGEWSDSGCSLVSTNETHTTCSCSHLTNFAILMNTKGIPIPRAHHFVLSVITYAGFIISSICLLLAFITFAYFKNLQNDRNTIHKNLCVCLLIAEVIFMAGIDQASKGAMCTVVALFLHYFFLAAFAWMCLEGIQLYVMLVQVFEAESSRRKYYYPFGYGLPLFVVGVSAAIDISSFGTEEYCWLAIENNFIWAFVAPVIVVIVVNTMFLSMAIFIMCRHSPMQTNQKEKTNKEKIASWVRGALVLLCLLGITWAFGLLYVAESLLVFAYIFTIANVFQGMFIFVFHCFMNEKVIKEYRRYIRNSTWMPEFIRDRYGATFFTGSNQHRSSSGSSGQKRRIWSQEEKRLSNTTGSCSVDHRKLSTSSNGRNSGEYVPVRFTASIPDQKEGNPRLSDEGIGLEMDNGHVEINQAPPSQQDRHTPSPPSRRMHEGHTSPGSPNEVRPLLSSPVEKEPPSPHHHSRLPSYDELPPPSYRRPKSGNFTSLPDLANPDPSAEIGNKHARAAKKGSLPELPRSPLFLRTKIARMNSDSQRVGHWSPLDEQRPTDETDIADDNSGGVEFLGITNLSPRRETLI